MAAELFCRMSSAASANSGRWATEISWIASRGFTGVRLGIGISDASATGIAYDAAVINLDNLTVILDLLVMAGLKCQLQIGGEGPPNNSSWYSTLAGFGSPWPYHKRPPVGNSNTVVADRTADVKSAAIALMVDKYLASGRDPVEWCSVELWNEPARGGAGAPDGTTTYWNAGAPGTWDGPSNLPTPSSSPYSMIVNYLNAEIPQIDFKNLPLISPSFASLMLDQVTNGLAQELETCLDDGSPWLTVFLASPKPTWGIN